MFDFFKTKRSSISEPSVSVLPTSGPTPSTQQGGSIRRELVRVVLKDTLRLHGVPLDWLGCEVSVVSRSSGVEELRVELVVLHWREQLVRYAPALQAQLLLGLDRFDPAEDHSGYIISWRFSPDCGCPFVEMPEASYWLKKRPSPTPTPTPTEPLSMFDRRQSPREARQPVLEPWPQTPAQPQDNFAPTNISPLR